MEIKSVGAVNAVTVITDEKVFNEYIRYGPDAWSVRMGCSYEDHYRCEAIEGLYQKYIISDILGDIESVKTGNKVIKS